MTVCRMQSQVDRLAELVTKLESKVRLVREFMLAKRSDRLSLEVGNATFCTCVVSVFVCLFQTR